jgi:hypothetical protein
VVNEVLQPLLLLGIEGFFPRLLQERNDASGSSSSEIRAFISLLVITNQSAEGQIKAIAASYDDFLLFGNRSRRVTSSRQYVLPALMQ